jgi:hypothetical protein
VLLAGYAAAGAALTPVLGGARAPEPSFNAIHIVAAIAAGLAFTLTLRARYRDAGSGRRA